MKVVYFSMTGNTEIMANKVAEGIQKHGIDAEVLRFEDIRVDDLKEESIFALGCPAKGTEELDYDFVQPFVDDFKEYFNGKTVGLFGAYGWGDGQWMRDWVATLKENGANVIHDEGVICLETPDDAAEAACIALGEDLASKAV